MNFYDKRWNNVVTWAKKVKTLYDTGKYQLSDGDCEIYTLPAWKFVIDEDAKIIKLKSHNTTYTIYEYDLEWDHGSYDTIEETNVRLKKYRLYQQIEI
jgi:hypothetical protein